MPTFDGAVFDRAVFDAGGADAVPAVFKVCVPQVFHSVAGNQSIPIIAYIVSGSTTAGRVYLSDPLTGVSITIYAPDNTVLVNEETMTRLDLGIYIHTFEHDGDVYGAYSAAFTAANELGVLVSQKYLICTVKPSV